MVQAEAQVPERVVREVYEVPVERILERTVEVEVPVERIVTVPQALRPLPAH